MWELIVVLVFTATMITIGIIASVKSFRLSHPPHDHDEEHDDGHETHHSAAQSSANGSPTSAKSEPTEVNQ